MRVLTAGTKSHELIFIESDDLPMVSVLMSAYNEARVIEQKLESLLNVNYPTNKIKIFIGSDCSTDETNSIIKRYETQYTSRIYFEISTERKGKPKIINHLSRKAFENIPRVDDHILIITDANVILSKDAVFNMVRHFKDTEIALVDSNIMNPDANQKDGISKNEKGYISSEVQLKHREGLWGSMIGPLGGCYAIRSTYFNEVPEGFLVDDFYIAMKALEKGGKAINDLDAKCFEDVSTKISQEFRRKTRISTGNFSNLAVFWPLLHPKKGFLAFAFLSHKVLRWFGPFFIILSFFSLAILVLVFYANLFYQILFLLQCFGLIAVPLLDFLLRHFGVHWWPFRYITYFLAMNAALLKGFINYLKGVRNNVWQPTKRNV